MAYNEFLGKVTKFGGDSARTKGVTGGNVERGPIRPPPSSLGLTHLTLVRKLNQHLSLPIVRFLQFNHQYHRDRFLQIV